MTVNFDDETVRDPSKSLELKTMHQQSVLHSVARRRHLLTFMPQTTDVTMQAFSNGIGRYYLFKTEICYGYVKTKQILYCVK